MNISKMSPKRPYLLKAFYNWLLDNKLTPYLMINITHLNVQIPIEFSFDDKIILNISPNAVNNLLLNHTEVQFSARFNGIISNILLPISSILGIYARENGAGILFESESFYETKNVIKNLNDEEKSSKTLMLISNTKQLATNKTNNLLSRNNTRLALYVVK
ncbi:Stringent starvation protein B [Candidatus Ecksteinia adelgidicola]|nr:Stringent starvation protein B [Candidatus Ecksteinia adelgidicola]